MRTAKIISRGFHSFWVWLIIAACLPVLGAGAYSHVKKKMLQSRETSKVPAFTAYLTETVVSPQGVIAEFRVVFAQRSDGSTVEHNQVTTSSRGLLDQTRQISYSDGRTAFVRDHIKSVSTTQLSEDEYKRRRIMAVDSTAKCVTPFSSSERKVYAPSGEYEAIAGVDTIKVIEESPSRRLTLWKAPSLGCYPLKRIVEFREGESKTFSAPSELRLDKLEFGEPASELFKIPEFYEEVPPSLLRTRQQDFRGLKLSGDKEALSREHDASKDAKYFSHRPKN